MADSGTKAPAKIIIVEDENITALDIRKRLHGLGYEVPATASSGEEALAKVAEFSPDLVLMDIVLRGAMDGVQAANKIRCDYNIPVVFLTAFSDSDTLHRAKVTEPFGYVLKPFEERSLHTAIEMALYKHRAEETLRETTAFSESLLRTLPFGMGIVDEQGKILFVSKAMRELVGENPLGRTCWSVYKDDKQQCHETIESSGIFGERTFLISHVGMMYQGKKAMLEIFQDITTRRQSSEKIALLGHAIRSISEAVSITDLDNRILFVNEAFLKIYGYEEHELVGKSISMVRSPQPLSPDLPTTLALTLQGGWHGELINRRKDGTEFPITLSTSVVCNGRGEAIALVGVAQEITHQKQLEQQVRQSQKMESMGTLVGGISHDFNNILNNILGFVYQLRKYSHDQEKVAKYTDTIEKSATRGAELANQLLSIARKKKRDDEQVSINALVDEVASLVRETFPKNITLETILPSKVLTTMGNHGELDQAVLNLCLNARDAMPDGGKLSIEVAEDEIREEIRKAVLASTFPPGQQCVKIQIRDSGTGIPKTILDQIFDPFFTTKDRGKGTGLGLSVVYNIVKNHRGTIVVDTEEGRGSVFSLYLPTVEVEHEEKVSEEVAVTPAHSDELILLVDDEASMRELGRELLEDQGYKVIVAHDGMDAVQIYRERWKEVALVVLDLVMPRLDGGQAFLEMKKINPSIRAFFCTGYSSDHVISSLLSEERLCALQKPFRPAEFARMVRETLSA
jgi:PAS domain S-box-containing protein